MSTNDMPLRTRAEATDWNETSRHKDVLAFLEELARRSDLVKLGTLGKSGEGQDMAYAVVSDKGAFTPEEARRQGKLIIMVEANIHAGEVEGKEAVLALARDLTTGGRGGKLLSRLCLVLIPDFNPDGNDRISRDNRKLDLAKLEGQVNPEGGVGTRYTGQGWNLNRDAMKQEAPETRNLARALHEWWPHVFIDCHTTDGSIHAMDLTYDTSHSNQDLFRRLQRRTRTMLENVARRVQRRHGYESGWYGNYAEEDVPESGWHTYPALPRFGSHYRGLVGIMDVLLETYSYIGYRRRCEVMYAWLHELFRYGAKHHARLVRAVEKEAARTILRGEGADPRPTVGVNYGVLRRDAEGAIVFDYPAHALGGDVTTIESFELESIKARQFPGKERRTYVVPHRRWFVPTVAVSTPVAYVVTAPVAERLQGHGIAVESLDADTTLDVESYQVLSIDKTFSPDVAGAVPPPGGAELPLSAKPPPRRFETVLAVRAERRRASFPKGTIVVRTAQRTGTLAVYLLEPQSDDGLCRWQFLDPYLKKGEAYPVHRVVSAVGLPAPKAE